MRVRYPWHFLARWAYYYCWPSTRKHGQTRRWPLSHNFETVPDEELVRLVFFGDLMPLGGGRAPRVDACLRELLERADLVVGNCEAPVADSSSTNALSLRMSEDFLVRTLAALAIEPERCALSVANNHVGDRGAAGLEQTVRRLRGLGILPLGMVAADDSGVCQRHCQGVSLGLVAWTRWLNRDPFGDARGIWRTKQIRKIPWRELKQSLAVDCLIGLPHWDYEWHHFPRPDTTTLARDLGRAGFDLLVGHHPHLLQPLQHYGRALCFHSLGNLTGPAASPRLVRWPARLGGLLEVRLLAQGPRRGQIAGYTLHPLVQAIVDREHHLLSLPNGPARLQQRMQRRLHLLFRADDDSPATQPNSAADSTPPDRVRGPRGTLKRALAMGLAAFCIYGGWALYANWEHGALASVKAALTQGGFTWLLTVISASMMELFFRLGSRDWTKVAWSVCGAGGVSLAGLVTAHLIAGTPELIATILPASILSLPYYILYSLFLLRLDRRSR